MSAQSAVAHARTNSRLASPAAEVSVEDRFNFAFSQLFTFLTPQETDALLARADLVACNPGDFILHEGAPCKALYVIVEGEAKVIKREHAGPNCYKAVELARLGLGSVIGEMSFLDGDLASASVIAERPTQLYRIDRDVIQDLIVHSTDFSTHFYRSLAGILSRRLRFANSVLSNAEQARVAAPKDLYRVLVVDDDLEVLKFVTLFLEHAGHTVRTTATAIGAIAELPHFRPDLVITDLMMSEMNGLEVCAEIRKHSEFSAMKLLVMSVRSEAVWTSKAMEAGANGFIMKPLNPESIVQQIEQVMRPTQRRRAA